MAAWSPAPAVPPVLRVPTRVACLWPHLGPGRAGVGAGLREPYRVAGAPLLPLRSLAWPAWPARRAAALACAAQSSALLLSLPAAHVCRMPRLGGAAPAAPAALCQVISRRAVSPLAAAAVCLPSGRVPSSLWLLSVPASAAAPRGWRPRPLPRWPVPFATEPLVRVFGPAVSSAPRGAAARSRTLPIRRLLGLPRSLWDLGVTSSLVPCARASHFFRRALPAAVRRRRRPLGAVVRHAFQFRLLLPRARLAAPAASSSPCLAPAQLPHAPPAPAPARWFAAALWPCQGPLSGRRWLRPP